MPGGDVSISIVRSSDDYSRLRLGLSTPEWRIKLRNSNSREREIVWVTKWDWDSQQLHNWPGPLGVRI